jgi:hypothetical protein
MATEPDIVRRLAHHQQNGGWCGYCRRTWPCAVVQATREIEALRSRVAAQDAELTRLRGLVERLADTCEVLLTPVGGTGPWRSALLAEARAEVPR